MPNSSAAFVLLNSGGGGDAIISFHFDELAWNGTQALASNKLCHGKYRNFDSVYIEKRALTLAHIHTRTHTHTHTHTSMYT